MIKTTDIIFENVDFIAVNKPAGLLTIPDRHNEEIPSLYKWLQKKYNNIFIVHRLDKDTTGIILFAKNESTHKYLSQLFELRKVEKYYTGIVKGSLHEKAGVIDEPVLEHASIKGLMTINQKGKPSVTAYNVLEDFGFYSVVRFQIHTGRTHQIRVHMKHIGHPLACDEMYGNGKPVFVSSFKKKYKLSAGEESERPILNRLALHSSQLIFNDENGVKHDLNAPLPKDMKALVQQLRKQTGSSAANQF
ncbi:RluA family pseudouridine synthase [soil metagenome]